MAKHGFALLVALPLFAACSSPAPDPSAKAEAPKAASAATSYDVRGEVVKLPAEGSTEITLKHESIPGFRNAEGAVVGMDAMTMPFEVADGVSVAGLVPGDGVAFTLTVDWSKGRDAVLVTKLVKQELIERMDHETGAAPAAQSDDEAPPADKPR